MARAPAAWVYSPARALKQKIPETQKKEIEAVAAQFVTKVFKAQAPQTSTQERELQLPRRYSHEMARSVFLFLWDLLQSQTPRDRAHVRVEVYPTRIPWRAKLSVAIPNNGSHCIAA